MNCEMNMSLEEFSLENLGELKNIIDTLDENKLNEISQKFETLLDKGINVSSREAYNDIKFFMEFFNFPELPDYKKIIFDTSTAVYQFGYNFSMRLLGNQYIIYPSTQYQNAGFLNPSQLGYIESGVFHSEVSILNRDNTVDNNDFNVKVCQSTEEKNDLLQSQYEELKKRNTELHKELLHLKDQTNNDKEKIRELQNTINTKVSVKTDSKEMNQLVDEKSPENITKNLEYIVKNGDTLWQIVKTHYGLKSNRDIANCVNKLVKYNIDNKNAGKLAEDNTPDGIFGDKIYVGQKIILANALTFRKQKFTLKNTET